MIHHRIEDWDDAYANGVNIPRGERWPDAWLERARPFRAERAAAGRARLDLAYGEGPRHRFDMFMPEGEAKGLVVFIHGGFWVKLDGSCLSHLAAGPLAHGHAVAMPSYTLCPQTRVSGIVGEVAAAIEAAAGMVAGPVRLTGHSAGGHLATRMICADSPLSAAVRARVVNTVSISGLHDLRPLIGTRMNADIRLDMAEARAQSPALLAPLPGARVLPLTPGLDDALFEHDGQITKRDIRALTLAALGPRRHELLWDIGAGSGSIGIEWMLADPSLRAVAIESDPDRAARIMRNARKLGVPEMRVVTGKAPLALTGLDAPHSIFVGGGGTHPGVMDAAINALRSGGRLVANAVTLEMEQVLLALYAQHGGELVRLSVAHAATLGTVTGWRPAMPITQWRWSKP